ncbi:MAG: glucose-6-phosphate dehydrogenase [Deltaproteobacteria bacterium]|nr:glucose-6-phosphate dehydrogenase [Deltaproteobacteria bacterium]
MIDPSAENPLSELLDVSHSPQPCSFVIFGGAGDLARRKLLAGLYNLTLDGDLPENFCVIGFARTQLDDESYRVLARESVEKFSRRPIQEPQWSDFVRRLHWVCGPFDAAASYASLSKRLDELEPSFGIPHNRIYYLSIAPSLIEVSLENLKSAGLVSSPADKGRFSRIIVEKPIGHDLDSARAINATLSRVCDESQIYRIDHYLGKETVQNIFVMRFANAIFEPLWNQKYIDHVQITAAEEIGVGTRGNYYEEAGALRDMVQNHILQLLCLTAMEPPWSDKDEVVRDHKQEVLNCLRPIDPADVEQSVVRAQYGPGVLQGAEVQGYRHEANVAADSTTETYVALKCYIDNWRWAGVPFYLRTGKCMAKRASEIAVTFKNVPHVLFNVHREAPLEPNVLVLRIQPDEGLSLRIASKLPGSKVQISPVKMDFSYGTTYSDQSPEAYERLMLDVMAGDATLFMRRDAVETSWSWVMNIFEGWQQSDARQLPEYRAGSWGPAEADRLIGVDGRAWRTL